MRVHSLDINTKLLQHVSGPAKCLIMKDKTLSDSCLVESCTAHCLVRDQNKRGKVRLNGVELVVFNCNVQNEREYKIGCKLMQSFLTSVKVNLYRVLKCSQLKNRLFPGKVPSDRARVSAG